jgi:antitoxin HicB
MGAEANVHKYPIELFWSDEDKGYIAVVPALPGCNAWGTSETEAISEVHDAIEAWNQAANSANRTA